MAEFWPDTETRETAYHQWCEKNNLDPEDPETAVDYEGGWEAVMYPDPEEGAE